MQKNSTSRTRTLFCVLVALPLGACSVGGLSVSPDNSRVVAPNATVGGLLAPLIPTSSTPPSPYQGAPGQYLVSNPNTVATPCTVILKGQPFGTEGGAEAANCPFGSAFLGITGWRLDNGVLLISKGQDVVARLKETGKVGFDGTVRFGVVDVAVVLTRV